VPGLATFAIDLRSQEPDVLQTMNAVLDDLADENSRRRNVKFELNDKAVAEPTTMDPTLGEAAIHLHVKAPELTCGAGHDAAEFVRAGIPSCMIFVRNTTGESHNPQEHMESADFGQGALLLTSFLSAAARS
jgi:N-carbamoyl-L-amino-acid hydrolase